ncbi:hypothetical protein D049_0515B, partial [Vibrio parahaemolyticus VPTS-2010]
AVLDLSFSQPLIDILSELTVTVTVVIKNDKALYLDSFRQ